MKKTRTESNYLEFLIRERDFSDRIINSSRSMISIINRGYAYEKVNTAFCLAHNLTGNSVIGKTLSDIWGNEIFSGILRKNVDQCFEGNTVRYEASFDTPKLGKRHFEVIFRPFLNEQGNVTHIVAETSDINELIQTRLKASMAEVELRNIEANLPIGFVRCSCEGAILHMNRAFMKIIDCFDEQKLINSALQDFYAEEGLLRIQISQLEDTGSKFFGNVALRNMSGEIINCRVSGYTAPGGPCTGYADFIFEDNSRELMLENRLMQAQKLETIGSLAGGIAHDFNNILATISGYAEMLCEDLHSQPELSEKAKKIQSAVNKGRSVIGQILTFSRQVEQEKIPVNVSEVLHETIGFIHSLIPASINLKYNVTRKKVNVLADPTQLFRVFLNLMTNAVQAMEKEGGILSVKLETVTGEKIRHHLNKDIVADEYALLTFRDTGEGMDPKHMSRIFEPFFTTREVGKGTGLGLSVIHGIITEMEGEIIVSSRPEKGSSFFVYIPISRELPAAAQLPGPGRKILFITGNKHESRILSLALRNKGYNLTYVTDRKNFSAALEKGNDPPDLIIYMSDSKQIHGDDLAISLEKSGNFIPCIIIMDPEKEISAEKLVNSGIVKQQLVKPVSLKEITAAIGFLLKDLE